VGTMDTQPRGYDSGDVLIEQNSEGVRHGESLYLHRRPG
jgi:hypothetical protein